MMHEEEILMRADAIIRLKQNIYKVRKASKDLKANVEYMASIRSHDASNSEKWIRWNCYLAALEPFERSKKPEVWLKLKEVYELNKELSWCPKSFRMNRIKDTFEITMEAQLKEIIKYCETHGDPECNDKWLEWRSQYEETQYELS